MRKILFYVVFSKSLLSCEDFDSEFSYGYAEVILDPKVEESNSAVLWSFVMAMIVLFKRSKPAYALEVFHGSKTQTVKRTNAKVP
jgi:hypothetical protein